MLKLQFVEIFLRAIPEMLLLIWGIHVIARKSIDMKAYMILSIIMGLITYFIRMLPIYFGAHTFIILISLVSLMSFIGISLVKGIYATILMFIILALSEFFNAVILNLLSINTDQFINPIIKSAFGIPSLIITYLIIISIRYFIKRKEGRKNINF